MNELFINRRQYLELEKIALSVFAPVNAFMNEETFTSVCRKMQLPDGQIFPLPIIFDVTHEQAKTIKTKRSIRLVYEGIEVGEITPESIYTISKEEVAEQIFQTSDPKHPGVAHFFTMGDYFIGGPVSLTERVNFEFSNYELTPLQTRDLFATKGWKTIIGFQTRNVPHRAHEYLLRLALEIGDGLFIQPLVGRKKRGDYSPEAIITAYQALINDFLPRERIILGVLSTAMRYAGPREAVFHAIVRRNYGCTHFIIGRDHAGVGNYYGKYEAQKLARQFESRLGIKILDFAGPFYCSICDGIVTERTCPHTESHPEAIRHINGTDIRSMISNGGQCPPELMRKEILNKISGLPVFISEDSE